MSLPLNQVILGDCGDVMAEWPGNSVDCVVTDPPYRIGFMGSSWDRALPPRRAFRQIFRVLKPGALAFVMSSPRQDVLWRMLAMLDEIGFELRQSFISWIYKSGFPKAYDVSKGIDRKLGVLEERNKLGKYISPRQVEKKTFRDEWPTAEYEQSKNKNTYGEYAGSAERFDLTEPASDLAKQWEGWKSQTGLKPALECILMVNKPRSEPTIVDNVLRWGTGAVNVDACRIPFQSEQDKPNETSYQDIRNKNVEFMGAKMWTSSSGRKRTVLNDRVYNPDQKGRFPANLLISDGALDTGEITKSVRSKRGGWIPSGTEIYQGNVEQGRFSKDEAYEAGYADEGSPFRFFDLDAWAEHHGFLDVAKPSKAERDFGLTTQPLRVPKSKFNLSDGSKDMRFDGVIPTPRRNTHPTCKPVKLMAYLIELGCPSDGIVVDPFLGSGTTCIAAKRLRRRWIGIEINPEYAEIAEARINIRGPLDQFMEDDADSTS